MRAAVRGASLHFSVRGAATSALLANIAASRVMLKALETKRFLALLVFFLPPAVFAMNVLAWVFTLIAPKDHMMPYAYEMLCRRKQG